MLTYTNRTENRVLIIVEPWGEQYWIQPSEQIDIKVSNGIPGHQLELVHIAEALVIYGWEGSVVSILREGKELEPSEQLEG